MEGRLRAWILAGGRSLRYGRDKARVEVGGEALLLRTARILREAGLDPVVLAKEPRGMGLPERLEPEGPAHPAWGLAHALEEGDAFFTPVDLPELDPSLVRRLVEARAVALGQPLLGVWPGALAVRARETALAGGPIRALAAGLPSLDVGPVRNLNRPED